MVKLSSMFMLASIIAFGASVEVEASPKLKSSHQTATGTVQTGKASWYGPGFHGRRTASGEIFNSNSMTAAHKTLPFGTRVKVTSRRTGRSVVVRINDRGPFVRGRIIDLSKASARRLGVAGLSSVTLTVI